MALQEHLISQFAKTMAAQNNKKTTPNSTTAYGKTVVREGRTFVQLDGSELLTPVETTVSLQDGNRVTVKIENHTAIVTGNLSDPSASSGEVNKIGAQISEFEIIIADKVSVKELAAETARINQLVADNVTIKGDLKAANAEIESLQADNVTITGKLEAAEANITKLETEKVSTDFLEANYAEIKDLNATNANIHNLEVDYGNFQQATAKNFEATEANIKKLDTDKLNAADANINFANIDFANITEVAVKKIFADYGIIDEIVISEGTVVKELIGVLIKGDLIEANTLKADSLIVKGDDGLYYKLNVEAGVTTSEQVSEEDLQNGIHGSVIIAKSIAAEKIAVDDLVAFGATIAGFNIKKENGLGKLYSLTKESITNTTAGVYMDSSGQLSVGDTNNYLMFYKSTDGTFKLAICADSVLFGAGKKNIENVMKDIEDVATDAKNTADEVSTSLDQSVGDLTDSITATGVESATKLGQLRELLSQVVTDKNGHSMMIETPESYVRTSETMTAVSGVPVSGATTTTGEQVYVFDGEYYTVVNSVYYKVTYTPATCTFNISDLEAAIESANGSLSSLSGHMDSMSSTVSAIQKAVDDLSPIGGYIYIDQEFDTGDGDTVPAIILGESDSEFKVVITNEYIAFMEGSAVPAYISGQTLIAQNIEVKQQLIQGGFAWIEHGGNVGLIWREVVAIATVSYLPDGNLSILKSIDGPDEINIGKQLEFTVTCTGDTLVTVNVTIGNTLCEVTKITISTGVFKIITPPVTGNVDVTVYIGG